MILSAIPRSWLSWDFRIIDGTRQVAEIDVSWWREQGLLTVDNVSYKVYREKLLSGAFILESSGMVMARAEKPDAFRRRFLVKYGGSEYILQAKSAFKREFALFHGQREIGSIAPEGFFTRRAAAHLPEELLLPVRVFILWLVIVLWKRESDNS